MRTEKQLQHLCMAVTDAYTSCLIVPQAFWVSLKFLLKGDIEETVTANSSAYISNG